MFLHDIEKPFLYSAMLPEYMGKESRQQFREHLYSEFKFEFTPNQVNALTYVEGARDADYVPGERPERPLAALCHAADFLSARVMYNLGSPDYITPPEELYAEAPGATNE